MTIFRFITRRLFRPRTAARNLVLGLWAAAVLTLITGYDYLRSGFHHIELAMAEDAETRAGTDAGDGADRS